jgi:hypothetical protein
MKSLLFCLLLFTGQLNAPKDVVRLPSDKNAIPANYGGKLVELLGAPPEVDLPLQPIPTAESGPMWSVEIKNLGPHDVTIRNAHQLTVLLRPNQTATFAWRGSSTYARIR